MRFVVCLLALALSATIVAGAQDRFAIGPLVPGMSVDEIVRALPDAHWEFSRRRPSGVIVGGRSHNAVEFHGQRWDIAMGDLFFHGERETAFTLTLTRNLTDTNRNACRRMFGELVTSLEQQVGPFGTYESFADPRSRLYGNLYGESLRIENVGASSRVRVWRDPEWEPAYTFREANEQLPYVVQVGMEAQPRERGCTLKIAVFANDALRQRFVDTPSAPPPDAPRYTAAEQLTAAQRLTPLATLTPAGVVAARANVTRWLDTEFVQFGDPAGFSGFNGYFAVIGDRGNPGGIVRGVWHPHSEDELAGDYVLPQAVCGVAIKPRLFALDEFVYLGPDWREEFSALDVALGGDAGARARMGRPLPTGEQPPGWETAPTGADFSRFYPQRALSREIEGDVGVACLVRDDRSLRCAVQSEQPPGFGFGQAALRILEAPNTRVTATLVNGQSSVGVCFSRVIRFRLG